MTEENIRINTTAELTGLKSVISAVSDARKSLKDFNATSKSVVSTLKSVEDSMDSLGRGAKITVKQTKDLTKAIKETEKAMGSIKFNEKNLGGKELKKAQREWKELGLSIRGQPVKLSQVSKNVRRLTAALQEGGKVGIATAGSLDAITSGKAANFKRPLSGAEAFATKLTVVKKGLDSTALSMQRLAKDGQWLGRQMMVGITLPLGIAAQRLLGAFKSVEGEYIRIAKVLNSDNLSKGIESASDMAERFGDEIALMGRKYAATEQITAAIVGDFAAMGKQLADDGSMGDLGAYTELSLLLSQVGDMDVASSTKMITSLAQTFNLSIEEMKVQLDAFNAIENSTALRMTDLADALPEVAGAAKFLNLGISETASIMAGMVESGFDATEAAHALKFGLTRMAAGENVAKEALSTLNVAMYNSDGTIRDMMEVLGELGQEFQFLSDNSIPATESQLKALEDLFGTRQIARMGAALSQVAKDGSTFDRAMTAAGDSAGSLEEEMERIRDSFTFKWAAAKAEIQSIMTDLGEALIDPALKFINHMKTALSYVNQLPDSMKYVIILLGAFAAAAGPLVYVISQVSLVLATFGKTALKVIPGLIEMTVDMAKDFEEAGGRVVHAGDAVFGIPQKWEKHLAGPFGNMLDKLGLVKKEAEDLDAKLSAVAKNPAWNGFDNIGDAISDGSKKAAASGADGSAQSGSTFLGNPFKGAKESKGGQFLTKQFTKLKSAAARLMSPLKGVWGMIKSVGDSLSGKGMMKGAARKSIIVTAILIIIGVVREFYNAIKKYWPQIKAYIEPALDRMGDAFTKLKDAFDPIVDLFKEAFGGGGDSIGGGAASTAEGIAVALDLLIGLFTHIINIVAEVIEFMKPILEWLGKVLIPFIKAIISLFEGSFLNALKGIGFAIFQMFRPISVAFDILVDGITDALAELIGVAADVLSLLSQIPRVGAAFEDSRDWVKGMEEGWKDFDGWTDELDAAAESYRKGGKKSGREFVKSFSLTIGPPLIKTFDETGEKAISKFNEHFDDAFKDFASKVYSEIDSIIGDIKSSALDSLKKNHEARLKIYDDQIDAIDALTKAEDELDAKREYMERKRELAANRSLQIENYVKDRALAIYEGRVDDARMLDLEERKNSKNHGKSVADLERDRQKQLVQAARDAEKEKIEVTKDALAERLELEEEAFKKQLDLITKYTPLNVAQFNSMMSKINGVMYANGVQVWPQMASSGLIAFRNAANSANAGIIADAQKSGYDGANAWLKAFMSGELIDIAKWQDSSGSSGPAANPGIKAPTHPNAHAPIAPLQFMPDPTAWEYMKVPTRSSRVTGSLGMPILHSGGPVGGKGDVPATLEGGEYVVKKDAVKSLGKHNLDQINQGRLPRGAGDGIGEAFRSGLQGHLSVLTGNFLQNMGPIGGNMMAGHEAAFQQDWLPIAGKSMKDFAPPIPVGGGIEAMASHILGMFSGSSVMSMHRPGAITAVTGNKSLHGMGRAVDIGGSDDVMQRIFDWALKMKDQIGLQELIYKNTIWTQNGMRRWNANDHQDHVHLGFKEMFGNMGGLTSNAAAGVMSAAQGIGATGIKGTARSMMAKYGWGSDQWPSLERLVQKESSWNPSAQNPTSSAWGLFQFLNMHKKPGGYLPFGNNSTIDQQITGGFRYIKDRYGTPSRALSFHDANNYYHEGGLVKMMKGGVVPFDGFPASLHKGEMVLPSHISDKIMNSGAAGGGNTYIAVDTFIGEEAWFREMMNKHDIKIKKPYELAKGGGRRVVSTYNK